MAIMSVEAVRQHVLDLEKKQIRQIEIIAWLTQIKADTRLAQKVLEVLERNLELARQHLARVQP